MISILKFKNRLEYDIQNQWVNLVNDAVSNGGVIGIREDDMRLTIIANDGSVVYDSEAYQR